MEQSGADRSSHFVAVHHLSGFCHLLHTLQLSDASKWAQLQSPDVLQSLVPVVEFRDERGRQWSGGVFFPSPSAESCPFGRLVATLLLYFSVRVSPWSKAAVSGPDIEMGSYLAGLGTRGSWNWTSSGNSHEIIMGIVQLCISCGPNHSITHFYLRRVNTFMETVSIFSSFTKQGDLLISKVGHIEIWEFLQTNVIWMC